MKRAAVFGMVVVVTASAWTYLAAQSSPTSAQKAFKEPVTSSAPQSPSFAPQASTPLSPLQQRYIDLATKKARLMTEEQLQQSVNEFDRDVEELHAWSRVEESARVLREVIDKHPQSRAAATARSAIRIIDQGRPSNSAEDAGSSRLTPIPDEKFERRPARNTPDIDEPAPQTIPPRAPKV
jgi:TolA-binding protein